MINGLVSLLLGLMIWGQFPFSGVWAVGVLVGIKLIFGGWMLIMLGTAVRNTAQSRGGGVSPRTPGVSGGP